MKLIFKDKIAWEQANLLMQPALIRVIDNIRKHLDNSLWQGTYEEVQIPLPGYNLCLEYNDQKFTFALWDLCYQVCFLQYSQNQDINSDTPLEVEIDQTLFEQNTGEIEWHRLDNKAQKVVEQIFVALPSI